MDTIEGMRTFAAVADQSSFTAGARQIGISTRLASKYVQQLEERLSAQLFNRSTRVVSLTETGKAYLERCRPLLDQFDELESVVQQRQTDLAGPISLTAPTGFGSRELVAAGQSFLDKHPKVSIKMSLSDHNVSLLDEGLDLAIRFGSMQDSTLVARKLMDMRIVVVASSSYLAEKGVPKEPQALTTHNCLVPMTNTDPYHWRFMIDGDAHDVPVTGAFSANSPRAIAHMAAKGLGIGRCPLYAALPFINDGQLQVLFEGLEAKTIGLYAVYPPSRHLTARIRALIDHLVSTFDQTSNAP